MKKVIYHINPHTGVPSLCRAAKGNCPYGGESGADNHFTTFSAAQKYSDKLLEGRYAMLPTEDNEKIMDEIDKRRRIDNDKMDELLKSKNIVEEINATEDQDVIAGVINGELKLGDWKYIGAALQNDNIPKHYITDVLIDSPEEFDSEARKYAAASHLLTNEELVHIIENDSDDEVRSVALINKNIDRKYVERIIATKSLSDLISAPYTTTFADWRNKGSKIAVKTKEILKKNETFVVNQRNARRVINEYTNVKDRRFLIFSFD